MCIFNEKLQKEYSVFRVADCNSRVLCQKNVERVFRLRNAAGKTQAFGKIRLQKGGIGSTTLQLILLLS